MFTPRANRKISGGRERYRGALEGACFPRERTSRARFIRRKSTHTHIYIARASLVHRVRTVRRNIVQRTVEGPLIQNRIFLSRRDHRERPRRRRNREPHGEGLGFHIFLAETGNKRETEGFILPDQHPVELTARPRCSCIIYFTVDVWIMAPEPSPSNHTASRNPRHRQRSLRLSLSLSILSIFILQFSSPAKQPFSYYRRQTLRASHRCSPPYLLTCLFTQLRISCVVFSQDPRPVEILNPGSDHSLSLVRSFLPDLALTVFFPLFILPPVRFLLRQDQSSVHPNGRMNERFTCSMTRTELSHDRAAGRAYVRLPSERTGNDSFARMTNQSHAPAAGPMNSLGRADAAGRSESPNTLR